MNLGSKQEGVYDRKACVCSFSYMAGTSPLNKKTLQHSHGNFKLLTRMHLRVKGGICHYKRLQL